MELKIEGRNLQISQRLQMHIARKLGQVGRHLPAATTAVVEITSEPTRSHQERIQVQVFLNVKGAIIRAERRGPSAIAALNAAAASLDQSAARFKGQVYRSQRARQCLSVGGSSRRRRCSSPTGSWPASLPRKWGMRKKRGWPY